MHRQQNWGGEFCRVCFNVAKNSEMPMKKLEARLQATWFFGKGPSPPKRNPSWKELFLRGIYFLWGSAATFQKNWSTASVDVGLETKHVKWLLGGPLINRKFQYGITE